MSDFIQVRIEGDKRVIAQLQGLPPAVRTALEKKVSILAERLEAKVKGKLSGSVLHVRTGALRRSIFSEVTSTDTKVQGRVASSGDVKYAAIHEFGFKGQEAVGAHTRMIKTAFGKTLSEAKEAAVRAHTRQMNMPERSFLRSSLGDMAEEIKDGLIEAVNEGLAAVK